MKQENKWLALVREQPLLFFFLAIGIVFLIVVIFFGLQSDDRTIGDAASPDSGAFLVHKDDTFNPFGSLRADNFVRDDVAFFARQQMDVYNPDKNPGVVFEVSEYNNTSNNQVSFRGKYEKVKGEVVVTAERLVYDRVRVSIRWNGVDIDNQLPSANKRNIFIGTLPVERDSYELAFSVESDLFIITPTASGNQPIEDAKAYLKSQLGDAYSDEDSIINYPAYLKGPPQHDNTIDDYEFHEDDFYDE